MKTKILLAAFVASLIILPWMALTGDVREGYAGGGDGCVEGYNAVVTGSDGRYRCVWDHTQDPTWQQQWQNWLNSW